MFNEQDHPRSDDGRFRNKPESSTGVGLSGDDWRAPRVVATYDMSADENHVGEAQALSGDAEFKRRVRKLLGAPKNAKVEVVRETGSDNPWGCETWEDYDAVTVVAGGRERSFCTEGGGFPRFIAEMEHVDDRKDADWFVSHIGTEGTVVVWRIDGPLEFTARIGNARGREVVLVFDKSVPHFSDGRSRRDGIDKGTEIVNIAVNSILAFRPKTTIENCGTEPS